MTESRNRDLATSIGAAVASDNIATDGTLAISGVVTYTNLSDLPSSGVSASVALADKLKAKGVDSIICLSVNDAFVMDAWGKANNAEEITMLADGNGFFTKQIGLDMSTGNFGGLRSLRYSMLVEDGEVKKLNVEDPGRFDVSDAQTMLDSL